MIQMNDKMSYIIGLTAHNTDSYKKHCFTSGMNEYSKNNNNNKYSDKANRRKNTKELIR